VRSLLTCCYGHGAYLECECGDLRMEYDFDPIVFRPC
jgi:hypothetical protein